MAIVLLTNNPLTHEKLGQKIQTVFDENLTYLELLKAARDRVHSGAVLLTHPLSGSIKPNETPFKSLLLEDRKGALDADSLKIIEDALTLTEKMLSQSGKRVWTEKIISDFQLIDYDLIRHGLEHAQRHQ